MSMTSLSPGPLFKEVGFNRTSTPAGIRATPDEIKALFARQPFQEDIEWPADSPLARTYDVENTSAKLVILNNKYAHKKLRGYDNHPRPHSADPDRHTSGVGKNVERHNPCLDSRSPDFEPKPKIRSMWMNQVQRPPWTPLENTYVNPKRHRTCQVSSNPTHQSLENYKSKTACGVQRKDHRPSISMKDNSALLHPNMSHSNKRYINYISKTYDMTNLKQLKQLQYRDLVLRQQYLGFHTDAQYKKYMMYIEGSRKRQFGTKELLIRSGQRSPSRAQSSLGSSSNSPTRVSQSDDNVPSSSRSSTSTNIPAPPTRPKSSTPHTRHSRVREPVSQYKEPNKAGKNTSRTDVYPGKSKKIITREALQKHAKEKKESTTPRDTEESHKENGIETSESNGKENDSDKKDSFSSRRSDTSDSRSSSFSNSSDSASENKEVRSKTDRKASVSSTGSFKLELKEDETESLDRSDRFNNNLEGVGAHEQQDGLKTFRRDQSLGNGDISTKPSANDTVEVDNDKEKNKSKDNDKTDDRHECDSLSSTCDSDLPHTAREASKQRRLSGFSNTSSTNTDLAPNADAFDVGTGAIVHRKQSTSSENDNTPRKDQTATPEDTTTAKPEIHIQRSNSDHGSAEDIATAKDLLTVEDDKQETVSVSSEILKAPAVYDQKYQSEEDSFLSVNDQHEDAVSVNSDILNNPANYESKYKSKDDSRDNNLLSVETQEMDVVSVNSKVLRVPATYESKYSSDNDQEDGQMATSFNNTTTTTKDVSFNADRAEQDADDVQDLQQSVDEDQVERKKELPGDGKLVFYFKKEDVDEVDMGANSEEATHCQDEIRTKLDETEDIGKVQMKRECKEGQTLLDESKLSVADALERTEEYYNHHNLSTIQEDSEQNKTIAPCESDETVIMDQNKDISLVSGSMHETNGNHSQAESTFDISRHNNTLNQMVTDVIEGACQGLTGSNSQQHTAQRSSTNDVDDGEECKATEANDNNRGGVSALKIEDHQENANGFENKLVDHQGSEEPPERSHRPGDEVHLAEESSRVSLNQDVDVTTDDSTFDISKHDRTMENFMDGIIQSASNNMTPATRSGVSISEQDSSFDISKHNATLADYVDNVIERAGEDLAPDKAGESTIDVPEHNVTLNMEIGNIIVNTGEKLDPGTGEGVDDSGKCDTTASSDGHTDTKSHRNESTFDISKHDATLDKYVVGVINNAKHQIPPETDDDKPLPTEYESIVESQNVSATVHKDAVQTEVEENSVIMDSINTSEVFPDNTHEEIFDDFHQKPNMQCTEAIRSSTPATMTRYNLPDADISDVRSETISHYDKISLLSELNLKPLPSGRDVENKDSKPAVVQSDQKEEETRSLSNHSEDCKMDKTKVHETVTETTENFNKCSKDNDTGSLNGTSDEADSDKRSNHVVLNQTDTSSKGSSLSDKIAQDKISSHDESSQAQQKTLSQVSMHDSVNQIAKESIHESSDQIDGVIQHETLSQHDRSGYEDSRQDEKSDCNEILSQGEKSSHHETLIQSDRISHHETSSHADRASQHESLSEDTCHETSSHNDQSELKQTDETSAEGKTINKHETTQGSRTSINAEIINKSDRVSQGDRVSQPEASSQVDKLSQNESSTVVVRVSKDESFSQEDRSNLSEQVTQDATLSPTSENRYHQTLGQVEQVSQNETLTMNEGISQDESSTLSSRSNQSQGDTTSHLKTLSQGDEVSQHDNLSENDKFSQHGSLGKDDLITKNDSVSEAEIASQQERSNHSASTSRSESLNQSDADVNNENASQAQSISQHEASDPRTSESHQETLSQDNRVSIHETSNHGSQGDRVYDDGTVSQEDSTIHESVRENEGHGQHNSSADNTSLQDKLSHNNTVSQHEASGQSSETGDHDTLSQEHFNQEADNTTLSEGDKTSSNETGSHINNTANYETLSQIDQSEKINQDVHQLTTELDETSISQTGSRNNTSNNETLSHADNSEGLHQDGQNSTLSEEANTSNNETGSQNGTLNDETLTYVDNTNINRFGHNKTSINESESQNNTSNNETLNHTDKSENVDQDGQAMTPTERDTTNINETLSQSDRSGHHEVVSRADHANQDDTLEKEEDIHIHRLSEKQSSENESESAGVSQQEMVDQREYIENESEEVSQQEMVGQDQGETSGSRVSNDGQNDSVNSLQETASECEESKVLEENEITQTQIPGENEGNTEKLDPNSQEQRSQSSLKSVHKEGVDRPRTRLGRPDTTALGSDSESSDEETGGLSASFYREGVDRPKSRVGRKQGTAEGDSSEDDEDEDEPDQPEPVTPGSPGRTTREEGHSVQEEDPLDKETLGEVTQNTVSDQDDMVEQAMQKVDDEVEGQQEDTRSRSTEASSSEEEESGTESIEERGDKSAQQEEESIDKTGEEPVKETEEEESTVDRGEEPVPQMEESTETRGDESEIENKDDSIAQRGDKSVGETENKFIEEKGEEALKETREQSSEDKVEIDQQQPNEDGTASNSEQEVDYFGHQSKRNSLRAVDLI